MHVVYIYIIYNLYYYKNNKQPPHNPTYGRIIICTELDTFGLNLLYNNNFLRCLGVQARRCDQARRLGLRTILPLPILYVYGAHHGIHKGGGRAVGVLYYCVLVSTSCNTVVLQSIV